MLLLMASTVSFHSGSFMAGQYVIFFICDKRARNVYITVMGFHLVNPYIERNS